MNINPLSLLNDQHVLFFTLFAVKQDAEYEYRNLFTFIRNRIDISCSNWRHMSHKRGVVCFSACLPREEGEKVIEQITKKHSFVIKVDGNDHIIHFGKLKERQPVFVPNKYQSSVANGWWPGTLQHGFWLQQWYEIGAKYISSDTDPAVKFIRKQTGFDLDALPDLWNTILHVTSLEEEYSPRLSFNPDEKKVSFLLHGDVPEKDHRVMVRLWETDETFYSELLDLPAGTEFIHFNAPFSPKKLGYTLYRKEQGKWVMIASEDHILIKKIHINMGIIEGKLEVKRGNVTETHDIVSYSPITVGNIEDNPPWVVAEEERKWKNEAFELYRLGSIFIRNKGNESRNEIKSIIEYIYDNAYQFIYIWDPYIKQSVLPDLIVKALGMPSINIRLLMSEHGKAQINNQKDIQIDDLQYFPRCQEIYQYLRQYENKSLKNLEIKNWFRKSAQAFHDRFILTEKGVWHFGSSLADLGNYHSTIYRLPEQLAVQVQQEFEKAWEGDFGELKPNGFALFPELKWVSTEKEA